MVIHINESKIEYNSFIYKWEDIRYKKYYIGSHVGSIDDGYLFSGIDIKSEYKKRPDDFKRVILSYHLINEYHEIRDIEREYLIKYDVENNDSFYNRTNESYGGYHRKSIEKRLNDIDENGLNSFQRSAVKMVKTRKEKDSFKSSKVKEYNTKKSKDYDNIKIKISNSLKGKSKWINKNGIEKFIQSTDYDIYKNEGWLEGRKHTHTYSECSDIAKSMNIRSIKEWQEISRYMFLPFNPDRKFKDVWVGWHHFLQKN